ncbi:hypothetical protein C8R47DRAFT_1135616 [Mycena vitilis]|nr:hypothetical protein C8R47DRAFT_1135616 [Mycena vitilis]
MPTQTRNQWRTPSPPLYPYADSSAYPYAPSAYTSRYTAYPYALALAPHATGSSYDSTASTLSACSRSLSSQKEKPAKIRKARRSVDSDSAPSSLPSVSPSSSPHFSSYDDFEDDEEDREAEVAEDAPHPHAPSTLRKQWAALSLRVRFGVFRAKRRMRARVLSL